MNLPISGTDEARLRQRMGSSDPRKSPDWQGSLAQINVGHDVVNPMEGTLTKLASHPQPIHYHGVLASFPAFRFKQHLPPALSAMPVWQNFPLYHLLGLPKDE